MSVARRGELKEIANLQDMQKDLVDFFAESAPTHPDSFIQHFWQHNMREKALATALSILLWLFFIGIRAPL